MSNDNKVAFGKSRDPRVEPQYQTSHLARTIPKENLPRRVSVCHEYKKNPRDHKVSASIESGSPYPRQPNKSINHNNNQAIQGSNQISRESSSRFRVDHNQPKKNPDTKPLENLVSSKTHHHITFLIKNPFGSPWFVTKSHGFINHTSEYSLTFELELQNLDNLSKNKRLVINLVVIRVIKWW